MHRTYHESLAHRIDASKLKGAESKIITSMANLCSCLSAFRSSRRRLGKALANEANRPKQRAFLEEFELKAENWRRGPCGTLWNGNNLRGQPTDKEIDECHQGQVQTVSKPG